MASVAATISLARHQLDGITRPDAVAAAATAAASSGLPAARSQRKVQLRRKR